MKAIEVITKKGVCKLFPELQGRSSAEETRALVDILRRVGIDFVRPHFFVSLSASPAAFCATGSQPQIPSSASLLGTRLTTYILHLHSRGLVRCLGQVAHDIDADKSMREQVARRYNWKAFPQVTNRIRNGSES